MRRGLLEGLRVDAAKLVTLHAGIDLDRAGAVDHRAARQRLRAARGWPEDAPVVGMLARYSPVKGHGDVVQAARILADRHRGARFLVAGPDGQTGRRQVEAWAKDAGLADRFVALDPVDDAWDLAAGLDVAVIASIDSEAVCRSALEYMALGIPIVATRVNVIPETVGEAGILVSPGAPDELGAAIGSLLSDPGLAGRIAELGLRRVREQFDQRRIAGRALAIIEEARMERTGRV
jgi:glycosyltransferase involved in cell wall biosynthesis